MSRLDGLMTVILGWLMIWFNFTVGGKAFFNIIVGIFTSIASCLFFLLVASTLYEAEAASNYVLYTS